MKQMYSMKEFVIKYRNMFMDVAKGYSNMKPSYDVPYTMLNYNKILSDMISFVDGYINYVKEGKDDYAGKVLSTAKMYYDSIFANGGKHRITVSLYDIKDINETFLTKTKELQTLLENADLDDNKEAQALFKLTDNQYRKISKVYRDDMEIYLWIMSSKSQYFSRSISPKLLGDFNDKTTPVLHVK